MATRPSVDTPRDRTRNGSEVERDFEFTNADFGRIRELIHQRAGISLSEHKRDMAYSRLARRLRACNIDTFRLYLERLEAQPDSDEWEAFTNALTTNLTAFFRESHHFPILATFAKNRPQPFSVWCSAASTGEEPYSIAMTLMETLGDTAARHCTVIATDIDSQVLQKADAGVYSLDSVKTLGAERLKRFFLKGTGAHAGMVKIRPEVRALVKFEQLNLTDAKYALPGQFDAIFCRNVMIYFDKPTQEALVNRLADSLEPGGFLFIGHAESLNGVRHALDYVRPAIYRKPGAGVARG